MTTGRRGFLRNLVTGAVGTSVGGASVASKAIPALSTPGSINAAMDALAAVLPRLPSPFISTREDHGETIKTDDQIRKEYARFQELMEGVEGLDIDGVNVLESILGRIHAVNNYPPKLDELLRQAEQDRDWRRVNSAGLQHRIKALLKMLGPVGTRMKKILEAKKRRNYAERTLNGARANLIKAIKAIHRAEVAERRAQEAERKAEGLETPPGFDVLLEFAAARQEDRWKLEWGLNKWLKSVEG